MGMLATLYTPATPLESLAAEVLNSSWQSVTTKETRVKEDNGKKRTSGYSQWLIFTKCFFHHENARKIHIRSNKRLNESRYRGVQPVKNFSNSYF